MGGFFGITSKQDCMVDVFFGVDYHSHLGTRRGGMAAYDKNIGLQRKIHNIENAPFRTKFENIFDERHIRYRLYQRQRSPADADSVPFGYFRNHHRWHCQQCQRVD